MLPVVEVEITLVCKQSVVVISDFVRRLFATLCLKGKVDAFGHRATCNFTL